MNETGFHPLPIANYISSDSRVTLTLVDGVANGVLLAPGGLAVPEAAAASGGGGGGGGCFLQTLGLFDNGQNGDLVAGDGRIQDPGGVVVPNAGNDGGGAGAVFSAPWSKPERQPSLAMKS